MEAGGVSSGASEKQSHPIVEGALCSGRSPWWCSLVFHLELGWTGGWAGSGGRDPPVQDCSAVVSCAGSVLAIVN